MASARAWRVGAGARGGVCCHSQVSRRPSRLVRMCMCICAALSITEGRAAVARTLSPSSRSAQTARRRHAHRRGGQLGEIVVRGEALCHSALTTLSGTSNMTRTIPTRACLSQL